MNVLSLFDGMSCGRIALDRAGVPVGQYYASEVDTYAIAVTQANWPDTVQLGDVRRWTEWDIDWSGIDLILAGSPCQGFSSAGKHLAFNDPRSKLFFVFVDVLNHVVAHNPDAKFLLENVKMKADHLQVITDYLHVEPQFINSASVSAQNRQRYYWANWDYPLPEDQGLLFQSVLDSGEAKVEKAWALTQTYYKKGGEPTRQRNFQKHQRPIAWLSDTETRWLSPVECERLQTVPEGYTAHVSDTRRYQMLGNGWTVDVIAHILRHLPKPTDVVH